MSVFHESDSKRHSLPRKLEHLTVGCTLTMGSKLTTQPSVTKKYNYLRNSREDNNFLMITIPSQISSEFVHEMAITLVPREVKDHHIPNLSYLWNPGTSLSQSHSSPHWIISFLGWMWRRYDFCSGRFPVWIRLMPWVWYLIVTGFTMALSFPRPAVYF